MKEVENIKRILEQSLYAIKNDNPLPLKELSDQTIHCASTTGDADNIAVAVIIYSIGKILTRADYRSMNGWGAFQKLIISSLTHSIKDLEKNDLEDFRKDFMMIRKAINKISGKLKTYIAEVFKNAEISKASRIHEHGISREKTAKMLGISLFDLQNYTGTTGISDVGFNQTINVKTRIKMMEELFNDN